MSGTVSDALSQGTPIVSLCEFSWCYAGSDNLALDKVSFEALAGECVLLCGRSGCGKSTLTAAINGLIPHAYDGAYSGSVEVAGVDVLASSTYDVARHVGSVFQDPRSQFFATTTTDEVAFGCENLGLSPAEIAQRIDAAFAALDAESLRDRSIFDLSSGQKQRIAIASAIAMSPEVVVMDEPSANLDNEACEALARIVASLKAQGRTVIVAEHRLSYLMDVADRVVRMEAGHVVEEMSVAEFRAMGAEAARERGLRMPDLQLAPIEGRALLDACAASLLSASPAASDSAPAAMEPQRASEAAPEPALKLAPQDSSPISHEATPALEARDLAVSYDGEAVLHKLSFSLMESDCDVIAVIGKNGAGKTTLARTLAGLKRESEGEIRFDGVPCKPRERSGMTAFVMQDADYQLFTESVEAELRFARKPSPMLDRRVDSALERLGLEAFRGVHPLALSGGQKQRVTIACVIVGDERLVLFDEPTSGLDGKSMREVAALIRERAAQARRVLVVTHDFEFIACCCTRAILVADGHIADDFAVTEAAREKLYRYLGFSDK